MNDSRFSPCITVAVVSLAMLAGCGGSQPPIGAPGAAPQSRGIATRAEVLGSWMLPEARAEGLLYVSAHVAYQESDVYVYDYKTVWS
jgi:hypothetical protein